MLDHLGPMADGEAEVELVGAFVGQKHGENLVIDQPLHLRRGAGQHLIQIQRRVDFLADLRENGERLRRHLHRRFEFG